MTAFKSDFLNILQERGFIHQCSDFEGLDALAAKGQATAYVGYDCTAPSLHIGNYLTMMMLHWLQQSGNKPITLMGGGTTMVGDPSGKDESRAIRSIEEIEANKASIRGVFAKVLRYGSGPSDAIMLDNAEWLTKLNWIEMLRDIGRHFSVNRMLTMDSVRLRLEREQEMSFIEFNYMVCQAYDFVELARRTGCRLQMGGSDQWGNIVNGVDLGRRMGTAQLFALTTPLLTTASGAKMGKTAQGAVWLNADQFSPYDFWQYWRNVEDADVVKFLKLFTILPMSEIAKLAALQGGEINEAKKVLATEATALLHGRDAANTGRRNRPADLRARRDRGEPADRGNSARRTRRPASACWAPFVKAGLVASNGEARRQIKGGGLRVNDDAVTDEKMVLTPSNLTPEGVIKLSMGKKKHVLLRACIGAFAFDACGACGNALPARMDKKTPEDARVARRPTPSKPARVALNVLALCFTLALVGRGLGESFTVFLKPIAENFGWDRAQVVSVYSLTWLAGGLTAPLVGRLFDRSGPRTVYSLGLLLLGGAFLVASHAQRCGNSSSQHRALRRDRHRLHRQRAEFDPARPLVRPTPADRDGSGLFRDRRGRAGAAAGLAAPDRSYRLARRLPDLRHRRAVPAGAAVAAAVAAVRHGLAARRQKGRPRFRRRWLDARERDAPPRLLGAVLRPSSSRRSGCTRSRRRSSPI